MTSALYHRFVKLCKAWAIDETKTTRDFAPHLHKQLVSWFPKGELSHVENLTEIEKQIASLERLNNDVHKRKYTDAKVAKLNTASAFKKEEIKLALSTKYIKENAEYRKLVNRFRFTFKSLRSELSNKLKKGEPIETEKKTNG